MHHISSHLTCLLALAPTAKNTSYSCYLIAQTHQSCTLCAWCPVSSEFQVDGNVSGAVLPTAPCTGGCDAQHPELYRSFLQIEGDGWCGSAGAFAIQSNATLKYLCADDPMVGLKLVEGPRHGCWDWGLTWNFNSSSRATCMYVAAGLPPGPLLLGTQALNRLHGRVHVAGVHHGSGLEAEPRLCRALGATPEDKPAIWGLLLETHRCVGIEGHQADSSKAMHASTVYCGVYIN